MTTVERTLIDLAFDEPEWVVRRAWDQAEVQKLLRLDEMQRAIKRAGRRRGIRKIKRLMSETTPIDGSVRSGLEIEFLRLIYRAGLPSPEAGTVICGHETDFFWHEHRLIVETDGGSWHSTPLRKANDRKRDSAHEAAGYRVVRFSDDDLRDRPGYVVETVKLALSERLGRFRSR